MARWTVVDGKQELVIESTDGKVHIDIPSGCPFITGADGTRDIRRKLGLAVADIDPDSREPQ